MSTNIGGWTRIVIVGSALWLLAVAVLVHLERNSVEAGAAPTKSFVMLRDSKSGQTFGSLSKSEIKELAHLTAQKTRAEGNESREASALLAADPLPMLNWPTIAKWGFIPIAALWAAFIVVRWVAAGFQPLPISRSQKRAKKSPEPAPTAATPRATEGNMK